MAVPEGGGGEKEIEERRREKAHKPGRDTRNMSLDFLITASTHCISIFTNENPECLRGPYLVMLHIKSWKSTTNTSTVNALYHILPK